MVSRPCVKAKVKGQGHNVKKRYFHGLNIVYLTCCLQIKGHKGQGHVVQGQGHVDPGQISHWSRSNKDSKERHVGSQQCQVASFFS